MDYYDKIKEVLGNPQEYSREPMFAGQQAFHSQKEYSKSNRLAKPEETGRMNTWYKRNETPPQAVAAAPAPTPAPKAAPAAKPKPVQLSKEVATAIGRSQAYQDTLRDGDYVIAGDKSGIDEFNNQTEQNIKEALKPYFERDVDPKYAQSYADKHKLMLGDDFSLTKIA